MKTILLTIAISLGSILVGSSQVIPNYSFETWSNGANSAPDNWQDHGSSIPAFYPAKQTTDHCLGAYAVQIESKVTATDTVKGIIETKHPNGNQGFAPSFPITTRYDNLKGFYKYTPLNGDSAQVYVYITKTGYVNTSGWGNLLAVGIKNMGAASTYTPFSVGYENLFSNFYYFDNTLVPDSGYIYMAAYKMVGGTNYNMKPLGNSTLIIDALNFDSYLSGINEHMDITTNFQLFPNANNGAFDVNFETAKSDYTTIKIYDLQGREIVNLLSGNLNSGTHTFHYDVKDLCNGNYLFVVATGEGYKAEKITIQK